MAISTQVHGKTIHVGDTVDVKYRIIEKDVVAGKTKKEKKEEQKERIQVFGGMVLAIRGKGENQSFLVRHQGPRGVGVERIFPLASPWLRGVVIKKKGDVRRAKLYYLRDKTKKEIARIGTFVTEEQVKDVAKETKAESIAQEMTPPKDAVPAQDTGTAS